MTSASLITQLRRTLVLPLVPLFRIAGPVLEQDLRRRRAIWEGPVGREVVLDALAEREFRSVLYLRLEGSGARGHLAGLLARRLWPGQVALEISCDDIGPGFDVMHGFATIVVAERIGRDCTISQQVTIGTHRGRSPVIGDRVSVMPGAIIVGGINVGSDVIVGAGAVVVKDVPDGATVAGVPARVLHSRSA